MDYQPVFLNLLTYLLYVLIPLIPAILIYKLFPDTKVGTDGILSGLKINASGAFAAYIITVILGHFIIKENINLIKTVSQQNPLITLPIQFLDGQGNVNDRISDSYVINNLDMKIKPDFVRDRSSNSIQFNAKRNKAGQFPTVYLSFKDYKPVEIDIDSLIIGDGMGAEITLKKQVFEWKETQQPYNEEQTDDSDPLDIPITININ